MTEHINESENWVLLVSFYRLLGFCLGNISSVSKKVYGIGSPPLLF